MGSSVSPSVRSHNLVSATPPTVFFRDFDETFQLLFHDLKMCIFSRGHAQQILPELWPFNNFSAVSLVSAKPPTVFKGF